MPIFMMQTMLMVSVTVSLVNGGYAEDRAVIGECAEGGHVVVGGVDGSRAELLLLMIPLVSMEI